MSGASAATGIDQRELAGRTFACLEGCGFCCTFQPEASTRELALLRTRMKPRPLSVVVGDGRTFLGLQNQCGACTLLERRGCTQYDLRPQHCRYFPFHLHFAERPEAYVNYTCRGVERAPAGDLTGAFANAVLANARAEDLAEHERRARETYSEFKRRARRAGAWGDADAVVAAALAEGGPAVFTAAWLLRAARRADEADVSPDDLLEDALAGFGEDDITKRPFYLAPDLRWLTFERPAPDALQVVEMDERGDLAPVQRVEGLAGWEDPAPALAQALLPYLRELTARRIFVGSVYAVVDDHDYEATVEQATWWRLVEVASELVVRARVLRGMGVPDERLADETARFYDSAFLDSATIGGFL